MPILKGALHTHTTCSDGQLEPGELVRVYRELGFQFVAITDHDHLLRRDYWDRLPTGDNSGLEVQQLRPGDGSGLRHNPKSAAQSP